MTATETITATVELAREDGEYGAARVYRVEAEVEDYGADWVHAWKARVDEAEQRYAYRTMGFITVIGAGGAVLSDNVVGNGETTWLDEAPAWDADALASLVRSEHAEYGRDPFTDDDD